MGYPYFHSNCTKRGVLYKRTDGKKEKENPSLPYMLEKEDFNVHDEIIAKCVESGLLKRQENHYEVTEMAQDILEKTAAYQSKLDEENFCFCPIDCPCAFYFD